MTSVFRLFCFFVFVLCVCVLCFDSSHVRVCHRGDLIIITDFIHLRHSPVSHLSPHSFGI